MNEHAAAAGLTVRDVANRYRVSPDKVRSWIKKGELAAVNTASTLCGRPRFVIPPDAIARFEHGRSAGQAKKPARPKKRTNAVDYFPD
jgi:hypothetical protein